MGTPNAKTAVRDLALAAAKLIKTFVEPPDRPDEMGRFFAKISVVILALAASRSASADSPVEWWLFGRYSQGPMSYQYSDPDSTFSGSESATVDLAGAELRLRERFMGKQKWRWTGSLEVEGLRQVILGNAHALARARLRVSYGRETFITGRWRLAPIVEVGGGQHLLLRITGPTDAASEVVWRTSYGAGLSLSLRERALGELIGSLRRDVFELSVHGLARYDTGGRPTILPGPLLNTFNFEAGVGGLLWIGEKTTLELRLRTIERRFEWRPANGAGDNSRYFNTLNVLDFGLGVRF